MITTREGRKKQRERMESPYFMGDCSFIAALDGLDIAEKAMRAMLVLKALHRTRYQVRVGIRLHWELVAENVLTVALAKWDEWCS